MVGGFDTSDISAFTNINTRYGGYNYLNGLSLEIDVDCNYGMALCRDALNFQSDPLAIAIAFAVRYKAAEYLADWIFSSTKMDFTKLINRQNLATEVAGWIAKYDELIEYIAQNTNITNTDCLNCKDRDRIVKGTILL